MTNLSSNSQSSGLGQELHSPALTGTHRHSPPHAQTSVTSPRTNAGLKGQKRQPSGKAEHVVTLKVARKRNEVQTERVSTTRALECTPPSCLQRHCWSMGWWLRSRVTPPHTVSTVQNLPCLLRKSFPTVTTAYFTFSSCKMSPHLIMPDLYANRQMCMHTRLGIPNSWYSNQGHYLLICSTLLRGQL